MFIDLLRKRRSIRQFQEKPVEQDKIDILTEAALRAPSSRSLNPWEFIVVQNKETLTALSKVKPHGAAFLKNAPLAIAVCGDPAKCDVWIEDCSIASMLLHLTATDLGLGSCWIQLRLREFDQQQSASAKAAEILGIEGDIEVQTIIAIGYPHKEIVGRSAASLPSERVHFGHFVGKV
jgi:nitroreductase